MRLSRNCVTAAADEKIEISSRIGLHHVADIELLVSTRHGSCWRQPLGSAEGQDLIRDIEMQTAFLHVELYFIAVTDER